MGFPMYNFLANWCIANKGQESNLSTRQEKGKKARNKEDGNALDVMKRVFAFNLALVFSQALTLRLKISQHFFLMEKRSRRFRTLICL